MIKLKLNRSQLQALCMFTNPAAYEYKVMLNLTWENLGEVDRLFNIIQIGESATKKWFYSHESKYNIKLKLSEAASLYIHTYALAENYEALSYESNVLLMIRHSLHQQLTNYQRRFYGSENGTGITNGGDQGTHKAPAGSAR